MIDLGAQLTLALEVADLADAVTLPRFRAVDLQVGHKADASEVTDADKGAEAVMRGRLREARPDHAVLGEEDGLGGTGGDARWRWVLDPIDGTSNYVKGVPIWATLIALQDDGVSVVGVVSAPALGRRWWARRGGGAFANGEPIHVSSVNQIEQSHLAYASLASWFDCADGDAFVRLARRAWRTRGIGDFWMHMLVAEGGFDVACEPIVALWDLAALQVIVEEAGGKFTDLAGKAWPHGESAVSTNGILHDEVLKALRG